MRSHLRHTSLAVSLGLHAALLGVLLLTAGKTPVLPAGPLRVQILPAPAPPQVAPVPPSAPSTAPPGREVPREPAARPGDAPGRAGRVPEEHVGRSGRGMKPDAPPPRPAGRPLTEPPLPSPAPVVPPRPEAPPQIAARPAPEAVPPPPALRREWPLKAGPLPRGGLSLGGPSRDAEPSDKPGPGGSTPRLSLRDQIAGLGSGLAGDGEGEGKQTVSLDNREPRFLDYLARLKWRIEREWHYPDEAQQSGVSGELQLLFTVNKAGVLTSIRLVESSGFPILDTEALRAVKAAAPFEPFPSHLGDDPWNIRASFRYYTPVRYRRG